MKYYVNNGLDAKYLRDPDGGVNLLRKKAKLGVLVKSEPDLKQEFPTEGFKSDLTEIPEVTFGTVWRYMIDGVDCKKKLSTAKPLVKGYNFFRSDHVLFMCHLREGGKHYFKSQVLPSMKKKAVYSCFLVLLSSGKVFRAHCGCPAGVDGRCNHVAATLFALDDFCKQRKKMSDNSEEPCTSKPCNWSVPRKRKGPVVPVAEMSFTKHDYAKKKVRRTSQPALDHERAMPPGMWPEERTATMLALVKEYEKKSGKVVGWRHILPQEVQVNEGDKEKPHVQTQTLEEDEIISPIKEHPISAQELRNRCERVKRKIEVHEEEIVHIEKETRGQANEKLRYYHRKNRTTASKSYRIAAQRESTSPTKTIHEVLNITILIKPKACKRGFRRRKISFKITLYSGISKGTKTSLFRSVASSSVNTMDFSEQPIYPGHNGFGGSKVCAG